jgi:hypothetical protein
MTKDFTLVTLIEEIKRGETEIDGLEDWPKNPLKGGNYYLGYWYEQRGCGTGVSSLELLVCMQCLSTGRLHRSPTAPCGYSIDWAKNIRVFVAALLRTALLT